MHLPRLFTVEDVPALHGFMEQFSFASLVTQHEGNLIASHIPFVLDRDAGASGRLRGHVAVRNPQLAHLKSGSEALVMFQGPHAYISPSWYAAQENVPTWNYIAVHAYGRARMLDRAGLIILLKDLVHQNERLLEPNQNRALADRRRVVEVLSASQDPAQRHMAELIQQANPS